MIVQWDFHQYIYPFFVYSTQAKKRKMAQSENTSNALIPLLLGSTPSQAVPFSKRKHSDDALYDNQIVPSSKRIKNSNDALYDNQTVSFSKRIENNDNAPYDNPTPNDPCPHMIIFTGNPHINASVQDCLTSYDQTEIFKFHPVNIIILNNFNHTQIQISLHILMLFSYNLMVSM